MRIIETFERWMQPRAPAAVRRYGSRATARNIQGIMPETGRGELYITRLPRGRLDYYSFTHAPFASDERIAASMKARPFTPSATLGKCAPAGALSPVRAALMASATSE
jgi:hypothetical protein